MYDGEREHRRGAALPEQRREFEKFLDWAVPPSEKVRLRFHRRCRDNHFQRAHSRLKMAGIASDGQGAASVTVDEIGITVSETYGVIVEPNASRACRISVQSIGRSSFVRATLASPHSGMQESVPDINEALWLTMVEITGAMALYGAHEVHGACRERCSTGATAASGSGCATCQANRHPDTPVGVSLKHRSRSYSIVLPVGVSVLFQ